jgi:propionyl-CoA carboxylase alpha chain
VRNDTGVFEGGEISIHYDPMIAKLVTHAPTREAAIDAQAQALDAFAIDGIRHNIPFLSAVMAHPRWREGRLSTDFIAEEFGQGFQPAPPTGEAAHVFVAVAAAIDHRLNERKRGISGQMRDPPLRPLRAGPRGAPGRRGLPRPLGGRGRGARRTLHGGGHEHRVGSDWRPGDPVWRGTIDGRPIAVGARPILNGFRLAHGGHAAEARVYTRREAELAALMPAKTAAGAGKRLLCPMPGLVKAILVKPGEAVKAGEPLAVVEAMKMENVLRAERDAVIATIAAKEGDSLAVDAVILEFA